MSMPLRILVAEDDLGDVLLLKRAFTKAGVTMPVHFARDGQEVLDYLEGTPPFDNRQEHPLPTLLLLDLKMPRVNGFEVLEWLRERPEHDPTLVMVLSSSDQTEDIRRACELGAHSYVVKPQDPSELVHIVGRLQDYWDQTGGRATAPASMTSAL